MSNPGPSHFEAVDRIFGYLLKYPDLGPCYTPYLKNRKMVGRLYGYSDASWASGREDRRSQSGWVWMLNGGPVSYKSKTQSCIAQSSSESEFIATAKCCSQGVAHRYFLVDLAQALGDTELMRTAIDANYLFIDNQSTIQMLHNPTHKERLKHVDIAFSYSRQQVDQGRFVPKYVMSADNLADIQTKALPGPLHKQLRGQMFGPYDLDIYNLPPYDHRPPRKKRG